MKRYFPLLTSVILVICNISCQTDTAKVFFREDWKELPESLPITQEHVNNDSLTLHLYGYGIDGMKKSHHDYIENDPYYVWSGMCEGNWALMLQHKTAYADLSVDSAKIVWRSRQSGEHYLRVLLKLEDGSWLISQQSDGPTEDWKNVEFGIDTIQWLSFDDETLLPMDPVESPDLSRVDQIGFTDLKRGKSSPESSRVDWIEVWAKSVDRSIATGSFNKVLLQNDQEQSVVFSSGKLQVFKTNLGPADLFLFDIYGRMIRHESFNNLSQGKHIVDLNYTLYSKNMLIYLFKTKDIFETGKILNREY